MRTQTQGFRKPWGLVKQADCISKKFLLYLNTMRKVLKTLWALWKKFAHLVGVVNTTLLLFLTYVVLFGLLSTMLRLLGKDPLNKRRRDRPSFWVPKEPADEGVERYRYSF